MVDLYLVRHGAYDTSYADDFNAPLTSQGTQQMKHLAHVLPVPHLIYSSPLKRAVQSAMILADHFQMSIHIEEALHVSTDEILTLINALPRDAVAIFVGHAPHFLEVTRRLGVSKQELPKGSFIHLKT